MLSPPPVVMVSLEVTTTLAEVRDGREGTLDLARREEPEFAFVAEEDVLADVRVTASLQDVAADAADHDVGAEAGVDVVVPAKGRIGSDDGSNDIGTAEVNDAVVTDDHVVADARGDCVGAGASQHDVVAIARGDEVVATIGGRRGLGLT